MAEDLKAQDNDDVPAGEESLEGDSYEIIKKRLHSQSQALLERIDRLNNKRKEIFGALDNRLLGQEQIITDANCIPRDMTPLGNRLLFGYQIYVGLKTTPKISDVFSLYNFKDNKFEPAPPDFLEDPGFVRDFNDLYNYYKNSRFNTFQQDEARILMIFRIGKEKRRYSRL